jgi:hypothetical protein
LMLAMCVLAIVTLSATFLRVRYPPDINGFPAI